MPELPEIETIKREVEKNILGKKIISVAVNNPKVIKQPAKNDFIAGLKNTVIKKAARKGKLLILELSSGKFLTLHLKMTGQLVYPGNAAKSRVSFYLSNGKILDFNDQRLFAELRLIDDWRALKFVQNLGPEPFELSEKKFKAMLSAKKTKIKPLLMDQNFIAGIGNLYAAESLFRAKINPLRPAQSLKDQEKSLLFKKIKDVLNEAIKLGGSSVDDYVRLSGEPGNYTSRHKVYARQGKPCRICKTPIKRIKLGGRGTYFCPKCQK